MRSRGYIMVETLVAMTVLSISAILIHRSIFETISSRREARALSLARHMLEQVTAEVEMRPLIPASSESGNFSDQGHPEFTYEWEVSRIEVPGPVYHGQSLDSSGMGALFQNFIGKLTVRISWANDTSHLLGETLLQPGQLWAPENRI